MFSPTHTHPWRGRRVAPPFTFSCMMGSPGEEQQERALKFCFSFLPPHEFAVFCWSTCCRRLSGHVPGESDPTRIPIPKYRDRVERHGRVTCPFQLRAALCVLDSFQLELLVFIFHKSRVVVATWYTAVAVLVLYLNVERSVYLSNCRRIFSIVTITA